MDTPSITCKPELTTGDSQEVPLKIPSVTIKTTEKPKVNALTTPLPTTTTTTTKIPSNTVERIYVSSSTVNSSVNQSQPNPAMYLKEESVNYRKIENPIYVDEIEYTCFKMDYKGTINTLFFKINLLFEIYFSER